MRPLALLFFPLHLALAAGTPAAIPGAHVPPAVLAEVSRLESQFDVALAQDCGAGRCYSKGCVYLEHVVVDQPRASSLPGLPNEQGPGSVAAQEYLTKARCDFAYESSVPPKDVAALVRRLTQKLAHGWLVVTVQQELLSPAPGESVDAGVPKVEPVVAAPTPPPPAWEPDKAKRELWLALLPHTWWMVLLPAATLALLVLIWALRRLGKPSAEEQALLAQLAKEGTGPVTPTGETPPAPTADATAAKPNEGAEAERAYVDQERVRWEGRIATAQLTEGPGALTDLLREWLQAREYALLAKAVFFFSDRISLAFPSEGDLAQRKLEFAEFMRTVDEGRLPSDADFLRTLNHHSVSSAVMAQADTEVYRSLREEFGATGLARLVEQLSPRQGAVLFALAADEDQREVARVLSLELRAQVTEQLLQSNRVARDEMAQLLASLKAARAGLPLPPAPKARAVEDRGRELDAAGALSCLLPHLDADLRAALFAAARERGHGALPPWYDTILYPEMLARVPDAARAELLLEVDLRALAGWVSVQNPAWQDTFLKGLSTSLQNAVRSAMRFDSRAQQLSLSRQGRLEMAKALQRLVLGGALNFADVLG